jgi:intracellular sulfur oxidation DsrE/DsrF family protein
MDRRSIFGVLATALASAPVIRQAAAAETKVHRLAIHIDQNDPAVMRLALNNTMNVYEHYHELGEEVAVEIVAYSQGLHMLRDDTSPVKDRITAMRAKLKNLTFAACNNTKRAMEKAEGKEMTLIPEATIVPAGVVRLLELQEQGWAYLRP